MSFASTAFYAKNLTVWERVLRIVVAAVGVALRYASGCTESRCC